MNAIKVTLGVFAGIAVGALAGILFAPAKGSTTRRKIINRGEEYSDELKEKLEDLIDTITEQYDDTKKSVLSSMVKK
ncbi:YtxH domain-containing protein [Aquirufa ecclesiirivi]|uniref:YtxH domain-containing protein n=1 Tax=Aquirufa ecclesiirivi TaxID=2715124 RepID=UPI003BB222F4